MEGRHKHREVQPGSRKQGNRRKEVSGVWKWESLERSFVMLRNSGLQRIQQDKSNFEVLVCFFPLRIALEVFRRSVNVVLRNMV